MGLEDHAASRMSTSWIRPQSANPIGLPGGRLYPSASHSSLNQQLNSKKPTAVAYSIEKTDVMRRPKGLEWHATPQSYSTDNLYLGEAHLCHYIPRTPGPGQYERAKNHSAMGKQVLTKKKHAAAYSFGTTSRFGYIDRNIKKTATPGPGAYVN